MQNKFFSTISAVLAAIMITTSFASCEKESVPVSKNFTPGNPYKVLEDVSQIDTLKYTLTTRSNGSEIKWDKQVYDYLIIGNRHGVINLKDLAHIPERADMDKVSFKIILDGSADKDHSLYIKSFSEEKGTIDIVGPVESTRPNSAPYSNTRVILFYNGQEMDTMTIYFYRDWLKYDFRIMPHSASDDGVELYMCYAGKQDYINPPKFTATGTVLSEGGKVANIKTDVFAANNPRGNSLGNVTKAFPEFTSDVNLTESVKNTLAVRIRLKSADNRTIDVAVNSKVGVSAPGCTIGANEKDAPMMSLNGNTNDKLGYNITYWIGPNTL